MYFKRILAVLALAAACGATVVVVSAPAGTTASGHSASAGTVQPAYWNYE
ncbi:MAG TPA: hypothetical protein VHZ03_02540 [Trebonia sp.]|jgi:hypothetical protein|nr:hypothetical protein [Trebonia sp.]